MSTEWTASLPESAAAYLEGRRLDEVECIISDLPGIARGKAVPASKFARQAYFHLPDSIFFQTITGEWGEAAGEEGFIERDMILKPDMTTASAAPWTGDWTLQVIHDAFDRHGDPIEYAPRNVLKRVVKLTGFVNSTLEFTEQPKVVNGASDLLVEVLGEVGRHSRSAVSAASLPLGVAVEIEGIFEIA